MSDDGKLWQTVSHEVTLGTDPHYIGHCSNGSVLWDVCHDRLTIVRMSGYGKTSDYGKLWQTLNARN